jgi:DNA-binding SARP family transcriptional activator
MTLEFLILGGLEVLRQAVPVDVGGRRQRVVLVVLLVRANRLVSSDELIDEGQPVRIWARS